MASKKSGAKDALKVAQSGTPVPEKDFSSSKKEAKADKGGGGSLAKAKSLPNEVSSPTDTPVGKEKWEGSSKDWSADYSAAKRKGISTDAYEDSAEDRISDNAGQRRLEAEDDKKTIDHPSGYKQGVSAYSNSPKSAHGFGHPASAKDGHLRNSGHSGAHRIGKKK